MKRNSTESSSRVASLLTEPSFSIFARSSAILASAPSRKNESLERHDVREVLERDGRLLARPRLDLLAAQRGPLLLEARVREIPWTRSSCWVRSRSDRMASSAAALRARAEARTAAASASAAAWRSVRRPISSRRSSASFDSWEARSASSAASVSRRAASALERSHISSRRASSARSRSCSARASDAATRAELSATVASSRVRSDCWRSFWRSWTAAVALCTSAEAPPTDSSRIVRRPARSFRRDSTSALSAESKERSERKRWRRCVASLSATWRSLTSRTAAPSAAFQRSSSERLWISATRARSRSASWISCSWDAPPISAASAAIALRRAIGVAATSPLPVVTPAESTRSPLS